MFRKRSEDSKKAENTPEEPNSTQIPRRSRSISATFSKLPFRKSTEKSHSKEESDAKPKTLKQRISLMRNSKEKAEIDSVPTTSKDASKALETQGTNTKQDIPSGEFTLTQYH
jgi:hypothetical protein